MPKLERESDVKREEIVVEVLKRRWTGEFLKVPGEYAGLDWIIRRQLPVAAMEIKARNNFSTAYRTIFLSERKLMALVKAREEDGLVPLFVAAFEDGKVYAINVLPYENAERVMFHREKTRSSGLVGANDSEAGIGVPIGDMHFVGLMTAEELGQYRRL